MTIYTIYPSLKPKPAITYTPVKGAINYGELWRQSKERDAIIKEELKDLNYVEGQICKPYNKEGEEKYGTNIRVEKICDSYVKYGKDDWPKTGRPFLVTAYSEKTQQRFNCTVNFLVPL